jgi:hypothetical protein
MWINTTKELYRDIRTSITRMYCRETFAGGIQSSRDHTFRFETPDTTVEILYTVVLRRKRTIITNLTLLHLQVSNENFMHKYLR